MLDNSFFGSVRFTESPTNLATLEECKTSDKIEGRSSKTWSIFSLYGRRCSSVYFATDLLWTHLYIMCLNNSDRIGLEVELGSRGRINIWDQRSISIHFYSTSSTEGVEQGVPKKLYFFFAIFLDQSCHMVYRYTTKSFKFTDQ